MRSTQRPLQLLDPFLLLGIRPRGCASPPKRSLGSRFHFVFPAIIEIGGDLVLAASFSHVAALQTFQYNLPLLFWGSLDSRLSRHSRLLAEAPSLTNFRVQFYRGALHRHRYCWGDHSAIPLTPRYSYFFHAYPLTSRLIIKVKEKHS